MDSCDSEELAENWRELVEVSTELIDENVTATGTLADDDELGTWNN